MWGGFAAIVGIVSMVGILVWNARTAATLAGERGAVNLLELMNSDIARNIELHDLSLRGVIALEQSKEFTGLPARVQHAIKFGPLITTRALGATLVLDAHGTVTGDSTSVVPRKDNFADRDYFKFHLDHPADELYVGYLLQPRFEDRRPRLIISRRIVDAAGKFQGIAVSGIRLSSFDRVLQNLKIDEQSTVSVLHADGTLLARRGSVGEPDMVGQNFARLRNFGQAMLAPSGTFTGRSRIDGLDREYVFARAEPYPLVVVIGLSVREVYQAWLRATIIICVATAALCLAIMAWLHRVNRELQERRVNLARANLLARTDGLTQLPNRRYFDEQLSNEKARAAQAGTALMVLLIDADHFKSINDRFGHSAGDAVLQSLARTIENELDAPNYFAARYGGEEFAVILPATPPHDAVRVAERIRAAVEALEGAAPLTVSIGVASATPPEAAADTLVKRADEALYRAKREGRNRVRVALP
jgi:diguanylate cyclase (GGDEF)-like protein